ncbi:hypothetical protein BCY90_15535 [Agrobacterium deltaense]|uniref:DUF4147 domain-containing protein n=1 Tax=Agrobacterium TaxID=357 RepID=UPI000745A34B|nr:MULTISPECIES: DUF4147 domain-containing protein [Agrobacterium]KVK54344.1 hypothetical protein L901_18410 [Agrobacterium sp. D14]RKF41736.1 hypothetical protein BCY90_15535 [Agrobacterium deltaense]
MSKNWRDELKDVFLDGLSAVTGKSSVARALSEHTEFAPTMIVAVGKAALDMYQGCRPQHQDVPAYIVTKYGHGRLDEPNVTVTQSSHPVPDAASLKAGEGLVAWLDGATHDDKLLMLVSGGASSLVEKLNEGKSLNDLRRMTAAALSDGSTIEEINARRIELSEVKGGKLLSRFKGSEILVLAISDVSSDDVEIIGSGIGARGSFRGHYVSEIVASNRVFRSVLEERFRTRGVDVVANAETLNAPVEKVVLASLKSVRSSGPGVYIYGGEPTINLPDDPGIGGRAQGLALLFAKAIVGRGDLHILVSGSDGSDGVSDATGAIVDGDTFARIPDAEGYLERADSGTFFKKSGEAIVTGPTGTNVADVVVLMRE